MGGGFGLDGLDLGRFCLGLRMGLMGSDANLGDIGPDYYCEWCIVTVHRPFIGRCGFLCSEESGKGWKVV